MHPHRLPRPRRLAVAAIVLSAIAAMIAGRGRAQENRAALSAGFARLTLKPPPEAPFNLRFFTTAVKTDSQGKIRTGPSGDPVKNIVGAEASGERGGLDRYTKIMFGADYFNGTPDPGTRIDPNNPVVKSGSQYWPWRPQPFRSWPTSVAITPDGAKLYVGLPGREGYPDWRIAVVDTAKRAVLRWVDIRPIGETKGSRPVGLQVSPANSAIYPRPYLVVLNQYGNYATVVDTQSDAIMGEFETGFYGEKIAFNKTGTRAYITDRFKDQVRVFKIDPGPFFTPIATVATGATQLDRTNPRDLDLSADGKRLYVANTLGHTIGVINIENDANTLERTIVVGGLATDVKVAGRWGIVSGHETNNILNGPETGHGLPSRNADGAFQKNDGSALPYLPVMGDGTRATTFDDIGSELNVFDTATGQFVYRYVDVDRDKSMMAKAGEIVDLGDFAAGQKIVKGSGPEQMFVRGDYVFVSMMHSDKIEVFRINQNPADPSQILAETGFEFTGGITPQGIVATPDGKAVWVANMQTEDVSLLSIGANGAASRVATVAVGVTGATPDPAKGGNGSNLFATDEEIGLRWLFSSSWSDDGQKSCGHCHWQSRSDGNQWNVGANAVGGVKISPQNKDISDNWPEWYEGLNNDMTAYASACNGEINIADRKTALFPQDNVADRLHARESYVLNHTAANSAAINRKDLSGKAYQVGYYDMAFLHILWSQNETRRMPNPLSQFPSTAEKSQIDRGKWLFTTKVSGGGAGCADCHHNGNKYTNGVLDDSFQDYNIHEPGVVSETTVDGNGPFLRLDNDYFFQEFGPSQDEGSRQNIASRNTKHLRSFWDSTPRWLHHGFAHSVREILLAPDSPLLKPGERGFNFRTVRTDHQRAVAASFLGKAPVVLPTEVPIAVAGANGQLPGDGKGPIYVSLDSPFATMPDGSLQIDRLGTNNLAPLIANGQINPALAQKNIRVIKDTHGKTSHLSAVDVDALVAYLLSLE